MLARDKQLAQQITDILDQLDDNTEAGFVLALATSAWLQAFRTNDPEKQTEAWTELLTHHVTAVMQLTLPRA